MRNLTHGLHVFPCSKREEKQKRVAEAKAAREREEQGKKQRQLEEKKHLLFASEQARKKREHGGCYSAFVVCFCFRLQIEAFKTTELSEVTEVFYSLYCY